MSRRAARVLVVDDELFFREAIAGVLGEAGLDFELASSAGEALKRIGDPSLGVVVLDIELPDQSGFDLLRQLRSQRPELRVVILSAHSTQEHVLEALRLGAFDYLAKPLHEEELVLAVRRALDTHRLSTDWVRLRDRLQLLGRTLSRMWREARSGVDGVRALRSAAVEAAAEILDARKTSLMLVDETGVELEVAAARGFHLAPSEMDRVPIGEAVAGHVFARSEPLVVADVAQDARFAGRCRRERYATSSFAVVPVAAGDRPFGVLCAADRRDGEAFDPEDLALLQILTAQAAQLLHASRVAASEQADGLHLAEADPEEGEGADAELAQIVCDAITAELEPARILGGALEGVAQRLGAAPVSLYRVDPEQGRLLREAEAGLRSDRAELPRGRGLSAVALENGQIVASEDPADDPRYDPGVDTPEDGRGGPLLCGPLRFRGSTLGIFRVFLPAGSLPAPRTGEVLAASLSAALRNVLLYRSLIDSIEEVARARRDLRSS